MSQLSTTVLLIRDALRVCPAWSCKSADNLSGIMLRNKAIPVCSNDSNSLKSLHALALTCSAQLIHEPNANVSYYHSTPVLCPGAAVVDWISSWLSERGVRGSILGLATWISETGISCFLVRRKSSKQPNPTLLRRRKLSYFQLRPWLDFDKTWSEYSTCTHDPQSD